jgi:hypothetical protein
MTDTTLYGRRRTDIPYAAAHRDADIDLSPGPLGLLTALVLTLVSRHRKRRARQFRGIDRRRSRDLRINRFDQW